MIVFFFFQAEDGIRDGRVTGVQTCALPISGWPPRRASGWSRQAGRRPRWRWARLASRAPPWTPRSPGTAPAPRPEPGRAASPPARPGLAPATRRPAPAAPPARPRQRAGRPSATIAAAGERTAVASFHATTPSPIVLELQRCAWRSPRNGSVPRQGANFAVLVRQWRAGAGRRGAWWRRDRGGRRRRAGGRW